MWGLRVNGESTGGLRARIQSELTVMYGSVANAEEGRPRLAMIVATKLAPLFVGAEEVKQYCPTWQVRKKALPNLPSELSIYAYVVRF